MSVPFHTVLCAFMLAALPLSGPPREAPIWLEIPDLSLRVEANGAEMIPRADVARFRITIARPAQTLRFSSISARVNTEVANMVMTTRSTADGVVCDFDLALRPGFRFQPGRNSVEIEYKDLNGHPHYASFLLQTGERPPVLTLTHAAPQKARGQKFAVLVGISKYRNSSAGLTNLRFADHDARAMLDFLRSPAGGSFPRDNIRFLINEDATSQNLRSALYTFLTRPGPDDLVVIYFAGHGAPDPNDPRNLYLLTYDTDPSDMGGTAFPMWDLVDVFDRVLKARRVVTFADSCHSFGVSGERFGTLPRQNNLINQYLATQLSKSQRAVITASDVSEISYEGEQWGAGHGVFTHFLLEGLDGKADVNRDGTVTAGELFVYVRQRVREATDGRQNPMALPGLAENLALSGLGQRAAAR